MYAIEVELKATQERFTGEEAYGSRRSPECVDATGPALVLD